MHEEDLLHAISLAGHLEVLPLCRDAVAAHDAVGAVAERVHSPASAVRDAGAYGVAAITAALFGLLALRTRGAYLLMITLALALVCSLPLAACQTSKLRKTVSHTW